MLVSFTLLLAERIAVPGVRIVGGTLRPDSDPTLVVVPEGLPLERVLVAPGERVRAGQTIALYDRAAIAEDLARLERTIVAAVAQRECLLASARGMAAKQLKERSDESAPAKDVSPGLDPETALLVSAALESCRTELQAESLARARIESARARLSERLALLDRKIALLRDGAAPATARKRAAARLDAALERNRIASRLDALAMEARALRIDQDRARLDRIRSIGETIASLRAHQSRLAAALERPRLAAPGNGTVARVRIPPKGAPVREDTPIVEIRPDDHAPYIATVMLTPAQAATLPPGTPVTVSLMGFPHSAPRLSGTLSHYVEASSDSGLTRIVATVALSEDANRALADPESGIALRGRTTASSIALETAPEPLVQTLKQALRRAFQRAS